MKHRLTVLFVLLVIILTACGGALPQSGNVPSGTNPPTGSTPIQTGNVQYPTEQRIAPLEIDITLDEGEAVEALIPLEGGKLNLEAKDGTVFTLEIPADSLVEPVTVRMLPIEQIEGLSFGSSQTHAVQLEPEGLLFFNQFATLTIETPDPFPVDEQIFFGYQEAGKDVFLAAPDQNPKVMKILLSHFSGYGVTKGLLSDVEPVRARLGGSDETRLQSQIAEAVIRERQRLDSGGDESDSTLAQAFDQVIKEYYEKVVQPRMAAAGESCAAGRLAVDTAIGFVRQLALLGMDEAYPGIDLGQLVETSSMVCLQEEYELCAEQHIVHRIIPVWIGFERQGQLLGSSTPEEPSDVAKEARKLAEKCLTFELEFESTGKSFDGLLGFDGVVSASVPVKFNADEVEITGSGVLVNVNSNFYAEGCDVSYTPTDGTFEVFSLGFETDLDEAKDGEEKLGKVIDMYLHYFPGATQGDLSVTCEDFKYPAGPGSTWFATFMMTHMDEQSDNAERLSYEAVEWTIHGGELFAERSWQKNDPSIETTEQGSMKLYHRPGQ